jgi:hypothetical protein
MIVDRRFRGAYCLHHQGWISRGTERSRLYRCRVTRWTVVAGDDRLGTGQWECAGGGSSREREREVYRQLPLSTSSLDTYITSIFLCLGLFIPDDGGSTHLWNVGRQSFYTAVQPRRQLWTSDLFLTCMSSFFLVLLSFNHLHRTYNLQY